MMIVAFIFFGPIIYLIVSYIIDGISDKINESKRYKYYGEEELINITTYNNKNITKDDIMILFNSQLQKYKQHNYSLSYKIFTGKDEQNYAWLIKTTRHTYGWGFVYKIRFEFSNGWLSLSFSDAGSKSGTSYIESILNACRDEASIMWKMNGKEPTECSPFNYIPISDSNRLSSVTPKLQDKPSTQKTYIPNSKA